jgi:hypothetical protein
MTDMSLALGALGCAFGIASPASSQLTAFHALKIAKRRLRPEVRSRLIHIGSVLTDASFRPIAWRFAFQDRGTRGRLRSVIVAAHVSSEHPEIQEAFKTRNEEPMLPWKVIDLARILIDSEKALARVQSVSDLRPYRGVVYNLMTEKGGEPVWHLSFYGKGEKPVVRFRLRARCGALLPFE